VQWIDWVVGPTFGAAAISVVYAGFLAYGFERFSRPSPSRFSTWLGVGLAGVLGSLAVAVMLITGRLQ